MQLNKENDAERIKESNDIEPEKPTGLDPMVIHPAHYNVGTIEAIMYIEDSLEEGFGFYLEGSIKKYLHRWRHKHDNKIGRLQDLKKAAFYLTRLIKDVEEHDIPICKP
jgi:hypothetical protein